MLVQSCERRDGVARILLVFLTSSSSVWAVFVLFFWTEPLGSETRLSESESPAGSPELPHDGSARMARQPVAADACQGGRGGSPAAHSS